MHLYYFLHYFHKENYSFLILKKIVLCGSLYVCMYVLYFPGH
jgi:hypothetical protein